MSNMSKDRVLLFLPSDRHIRNFNAPSRAGYLLLLYSCFSIKEPELVAHAVHDQTQLKEGVWVIARPSQYGRFIAARCQSGGENWVKEMCPTLFTQAAAEQDVYTRLACSTGVRRGDVKRVLLHARYTPETKDTVEDVCRAAADPGFVLDVSSRPYEKRPMDRFTAGVAPPGMHPFRESGWMMQGDARARG